MDKNGNNFLLKLEECTLPLDQFDHVGHLYASWLYLKKFPLNIAVSKTAISIQRLALSVGARTKFHKTLTEAAVQIVYYRMQSDPGADFSDFLAANEDLVSDLPKVILNYYSEDRLQSEEAREVYLEPDLKQFSAV